jgi:uncharacterized phage protein (TIGR01671 family)
MKSIVYRLWNEKGKHYVDNVQNNDSHENHLEYHRFVADDGFEFELATGLTDKNGKMIFDGDVLESDFEGLDEENITYTVKFKNGGFIAVSREEEGEFADDFASPLFEILELGNGRVIGNVHEKSEKNS